MGNAWLRIANILYDIYVIYFINYFCIKLTIWKIYTTIKHVKYTLQIVYGFTKYPISNIM